MINGVKPMLGPLESVDLRHAWLGEVAFSPP
jgi:hypothetical protein